MDSVHKIQCIVQIVSRKRSAQFYLLHTTAGLIPVQLPGKRKMEAVFSPQSMQDIVDIHAPSVLLPTPF